MFTFNYFNFIPEKKVNTFFFHFFFPKMFLKSQLFDSLSQLGNARGKLRGYFNAKGCFNGESVILIIYVLNASNCGNLLSRLVVRN